MDFPRPLADDDSFYRVIRGLHLKDNGRVSPGAFCKTTGTNQMSVDWAEKSTPQESIDRFAHWGDRKAVASITANICRGHSQALDYKPLSDNPAHSEVVGEDSKSLRKALARQAQIVYELKHD